MAPVSGVCDPAFAPVRREFLENFSSRGEVGAAVCVIVDGRVVVDLWGGVMDEAGERPWEPDTLVNAFSVGKGFLALLFAHFAGTSELDVDWPVAHVWPEFAAEGKGSITIRQLLSHQAGLPAVRRRLPPGAMFDWDLMVEALAAEAPWWKPGSAHGYHTNTLGFLAGEILRRITGASPGALLREVIAEPLGADLLLGFGPEQDHRVADFLWPDPPPPEEEPPGLGPEELLRFNCYFNPSGLSGAGVVNAREWRAAEMPSVNTHATARGIAVVYAALAAAGGSSDGDIELVAPAALAAAIREQVSGHDLVLGRPSRFGLGFQLTQPERPLGPNPGAFGHFGAGGSLGFCDPAAGVGFGYVMNQLGARWQNPRNQALVDAVYESLADTPRTPRHGGTAPVAAS